MQYLENDVNSTAFMPKKRTTTEEAPGTRLRCFDGAVQNGSFDYIQSHPIISLATIWLHTLLDQFWLLFLVIRVFEDKDVIRPSPTPHCQHSKTEGKKGEGKGEEKQKKGVEKNIFGYSCTTD